MKSLACSRASSGRSYQTRVTLRRSDQEGPGAHGPE